MQDNFARATIGYLVYIAPGFKLEGARHISKGMEFHCTMQDNFARATIGYLVYENFHCSLDSWRFAVRTENLDRIIHLDRLCVPAGWLA